MINLAIIIIPSVPYLKHCIRPENIRPRCQSNTSIRQPGFPSAVKIISLNIIGIYFFLIRLVYFRHLPVNTPFHK